MATSLSRVLRTAKAAYALDRQLSIMCCINKQKSATECRFLPVTKQKYLTVSEKGCDHFKVRVICDLPMCARKTVIHAFR